MSGQELDDILKDPVFNLTEEEKSLFSFPKSIHVKAKREKAEYIAQHTACKDFNKYEPLFKKVHAELKAGQRSLIKYSEKKLKEGGFYIISGVMVYLEKIEWEAINKNTNHPDGRTHLIYENGMESDIKVRTLAKNICRDGFVINPIKTGDITTSPYNSSLQLLEKIDEVKPTESKYESDKIDTTGWNILSLIIKDVYFKQILTGEKTIEYRKLKPSHLKQYTWVDKDGTRYLKKFDALRLYVGYRKGRDSALVEVVDTKYDTGSEFIEYYLGKILEVRIKRMS